MFAEDALQLHPLDDSLEQWQGPDVIGTELEAVGLSVFAWEDFAVWSGVVRETSDRGRVSVRALRITPRMASENRRTCDQGTKRGQREGFFGIGVGGCWGGGLISHRISNQASGFQEGFGNA